MALRFVKPPSGQEKGSSDMSDTKVALMTGTGQGIGRGCAIEMVRAGYEVSLMSPSDRSIELARELGDS